MLDLALQTAVDLPTEAAQPAADTLRTVADGLITAGFVTGAYRVARRGVMGHYTDGRTVDVEAARTDRDPKAVAIMACAYATFTALTTAAVYLLASLPWALAWAGACAFLAAVVAWAAAKDATPVDDIRLLAEARRGGDNDS